MKSNNSDNKSSISKFLHIVEVVGNLLPHPATLFASFAVGIIIISAIVSNFNISVIHPGTGEEIHPVNLLSIDGLHRILTSMVTNFTSFAPLGTVLVAMLGIGVAEKSGLIGAAIRLLVISAPKKLLTFAVVLAGVLSNTASEIGYVLIVPLAGIIFLGVGRHPLAGLAAAFAGVSGGYSANLLLGTLDPLLAGLSEEAAKIIDPEYFVNPACNYYFMAASTFIITFIGAWTTERFVIPRLGEYTGEEKPEEIKKLTSDEKRGLWFALFVSIGLAVVIVIGLVPENGFLREVGTGDVLRSPFLIGIVSFIFLGAAVMGIAYGIGAKTLKSDSDVVHGMSKSMETLATYMVLVFFAAQFVAFFNWTNLGLILAVNGAEVLKSSGLGEIPLILGFILISAVINLFIGSASAKWAIMAPVFIPMFMLVGYSPEFIQVAYRIGDSSTNIISPMMTYFALIVAFIERYDKKAGIGTLIALMLPYSVLFLISWSLLLVVWMLLDIPIGPGAELFLVN